MFSRLVEHISHRPYYVVLTHSHPNYSAVDVHAEDKLVPNMYGTKSLHTQFGQTPLTIARSQGHGRIVQLLREANRQRYSYYGQVPH